MKVDILGVNIDQIDNENAVKKVKNWLNQPGNKRYIVTPNIEFIILAQKDQEFRKILNNADLAIPDSARFGWALDQLKEKNPFLKLLKWPLFLSPRLFHFDVVTGTDLMEQLIKLSSEKAFTVGFLGGRAEVAIRLKERLIKNYPKLEISFSDSGAEIDQRGEGPEVKVPTTDLLFVAFGQVKQEKWIAKNLKKQPVRIMMGVGGALDYLSGQTPRAPRWIRTLGFEWLFRLMIQPWRVKRFGSLVKFIFTILLT